MPRVTKNYNNNSIKITSKTNDLNFKELWTQKQKTVTQNFVHIKTPYI